MRIHCPYCGSRDLREFSYLGDVDAAAGHPWDEMPGDLDGEADRVYSRDNPAGPHRGLWYHDAGCRSWLVVERDTRTHEILSVAFAEGAAR